LNRSTKHRRSDQRPLSSIDDATVRPASRLSLRVDEPSVGGVRDIELHTSDRTPAQDTQGLPRWVGRYGAIFDGYNQLRGKDPDRRSVRAARLGWQRGQANDPIEERIRKSVIGEREAPRIVIVDYDPAWPQRFRREAAKIRATLGEAVLAIEHIGSTSVPGLAAKPIVAILVVVEDSSDEVSYVAALESAGYVLRVREPDIDEHRMFRTHAKDVHTYTSSPRVRQRSSATCCCATTCVKAKKIVSSTPGRNALWRAGIGRAWITTPRQRPRSSKALSPELLPDDLHEKS
jgi:hypothetical protein